MEILSSIDELSFPVALRQDVIADPTSDHALLEATRTGDEDAFAELVSRYRNQITSYIYRMTNDYDGAVDLAQETFVRLYRAVDRYQSTYAFSTYIYRIATNLAISELRKRKRRRLVSLTGFFSVTMGTRIVSWIRLTSGRCRIPNLSPRKDASQCSEQSVLCRRNTGRR